MNKVVFILIFFFIACDNSDESKDETKKLAENIAIVTNQGAGFLTIINLTTNSIQDSINLSTKLQAFVDNGGAVDEVFIDSPRPHYVQTSFDGRYVYVVSTFRQGALIKLDAEFNVLAFQEIKNTTFPAHMQLTKDNSQIYLSTWTTNKNGESGGISSDNNYMIHLSADNLSELHRYATPAGAHGIKLTPDEQTLIIGHDLVDYINIIDVNNLDQDQNSEFKLRAGADTDGSDVNDADVLSPTQVGISPYGKFAFFSCKEASKILVYDIPKKDTLGFVDLQKLFNLEGTKLGPYSIEVGPKTNYSSSTKKYAYVNFKIAGYFARLSINPSGTKASDILSANATTDIISLLQTDARPHGLDITDDGKTAVVSSEFLKSDNTTARVFIVDLEKWKIVQTLTTKVQSRGLCIYPGKGN